MSPSTSNAGPGSIAAGIENAVRWPERFAPENAALFARNEIVISAPAEQVWAWLVRAELWPTWYSNACDIHFLSHTGPDLRDRSRLRWKTFGAKVTSKVLEFEPRRRIAWDVHGIGLEAYHVWVLKELEGGRTHVLSEQTQNGWVARLGRLATPKRMQGMHQVWLEGLSAKAESGLPG